MKSNDIIIVVSTSIIHYLSRELQAAQVRCKSSEALNDFGYPVTAGNKCELVLSNRLHYLK